MRKQNLLIFEVQTRSTLQKKWGKNFYVHVISVDKVDLQHQKEELGKNGHFFVLVKIQANN